MAPRSCFYFLSTALLHINHSISVSETMKYVDCKYCDFHARSEASMEDHLEWEHKDKLKQDLEATDTSHADERIDGEENLIDVDLTSEGVNPKFSPIRQPGEVIII